MKRFRKALLALAALLSVVIVGGIWLVDSALNVASDMVDTTLGGAQKVQAVAQREFVGVTHNAQNGARVALSGAEHAVDGFDAPTPSRNTIAVPPVAKAPEPSAKQGMSQQAKTEARQSQTDGDGLPSLGSALSLFLNDDNGDEGAPDITTLLTSGNKAGKNDKPGGENADDSLMGMIPGANSPTLQRWMDGKYKGKESQALDDAMEDPKVWRLMFFLGGGM